ncbi:MULTISPECIES: sulfate adenylyltransferase [Methanoculleus]|jgi:sulfate adenylyltransferase|uniref:sulfate adenylyltransferase n=1 Tax=Methanoculleus TaxID=45989 RepID=UPI0025E9D594|nr:sulfate adenylyltransferase [Methanoculleus sp. UBA377]
MTALPYGGTLVNRVLSDAARREILAGIDGRKTIAVDTQGALDAEKIAIGAFSPLTGFMGEADYSGVLARSRLKNGLTWTIPIILAPRIAENPGLGDIHVGDSPVLLYHGEPIAVLHVEEKFPFDKTEFARRVYGTTEDAHPDVKILRNAGDTIFSGPIDLINRVSGADELTPEETREEFDRRGWETVVAFQTRNPPHVAHEYIQRCALEQVDGLFIHPVVGELKKDDFPAEAVIESYQYLVDHYYPKSRVFLAPLAISMRYAGPRAAVFLAIIRKNYGCTHFIVGRDIAGVGNYYDPYGAHALFRNLDLGIEAMLFRESYYCRKCRSMVTEKTCGHPESDHSRVSMTQIRKMIVAGEQPPIEVMRPELADLLVKYRPYLEAGLK